MAKTGVFGFAQAMKAFDKELGKKRKKLKRAAEKASSHLLKESRGRAPVLEGTLIASMHERVIDKGRGNGLRIEVFGGDTPYAHRMHEGNYQAHPRSDYKRRTSKKTGRTYYVLKRTAADKSKEASL